MNEVDWMIRELSFPQGETKKKKKKKKNQDTMIIKINFTRLLLELN